MSCLSPDDVEDHCSQDKLLIKADERTLPQLVEEHLESLFLGSLLRTVRDDHRVRLLGIGLVLLEPHAKKALLTSDLLNVELGLTIELGDVGRVLGWPGSLVDLTSQPGELVEGHQLNYLAIRSAVVATFLCSTSSCGVQLVEVEVLVEMGLLRHQLGKLHRQQQLAALRVRNGQACLLSFLHQRLHLLLELLLLRGTWPGLQQAGLVLHLLHPQLYDLISELEGPF